MNRSTLALACFAGLISFASASLPQPQTPPGTTIDDVLQYREAVIQPSISLIDTRNFLPPTMEINTRSLLMHAAADTAGLQVRHIDDNLMLVQSGDDAESQARIDRLMDLLRQIQATAPSYRVSVRVLKFPLAEAPAVGAKIGPQNSMVLAESMVRGSTDTTIESIEEIAYISNWSPIVADNAVAYEAQVTQAEQGFRGHITIQASETPGAVRFSMRGEVRRVHLTTVEQPVISSDQRLSYTLARTHVRSLDVAIEALATQQPSTLIVDPNNPASNLTLIMEPSYIVTSVFEGIDPAECFAIAVRVMSAP